MRNIARLNADPDHLGLIRAELNEEHEGPPRVILHGVECRQNESAGFQHQPPAEEDVPRGVSARSNERLPNSGRRAAGYCSANEPDLGRRPASVHQQGCPTSLLVQLIWAIWRRHFVRPPEGPGTGALFRERHGCRVGRRGLRTSKRMPFVCWQGQFEGFRGSRFAACTFGPVRPFAKVVPARSAVAACANPPPIWPRSTFSVTLTSSVATSGHCVTAAGLVSSPHVYPLNPSDQPCPVVRPHAIPAGPGFAMGRIRNNGVPSGRSFLKNSKNRLGC